MQMPYLVRFNVPSIQLGLMNGDCKVWKLGHLSGQLRTNISDSYISRLEHLNGQLGTVIGANNGGGKRVFRLAIFVFEYDV